MIIKNIVYVINMMLWIFSSIVNIHLQRLFEGFGDPVVNDASKEGVYSSIRNLHFDVSSVPSLKMEHLRTSRMNATFGGVWLNSFPRKSCGGEWCAKYR